MKPEDALDKVFEDTPEPASHTTEAEKVKPALMMDVDGVLLCGRGCIEKQSAQTIIENPDEYIVENFTHRWWPNEPVRVNFPKTMKDRINKLQEHFDLYWITYGFLHHADMIEKAYELGPIEHIAYEIKFSGGPMKHWGVERWVEQTNRPFAWVDDSFIPREWQAGDYKYAESLNTVPHKFVIPDPEIGLTDEHVNDLIIWAESLS